MSPLEANGLLRVAEQSIESGDAVAMRNSTRGVLIVAEVQVSGAGPPRYSANGEHGIFLYS